MYLKTFYSVVHLYPEKIILIWNKSIFVSHNGVSVSIQGQSSFQTSPHDRKPYIHDPDPSHLPLRYLQFIWYSQTDVLSRILPPYNFCHHPWCVGDKSYHKALSIMFSCNGMSDHNKSKVKFALLWCHSLLKRASQNSTYETPQLAQIIREFSWNYSS